MRVLITGAAGFIGSHLGDRLERAGHECFGADNLETGRRENVNALNPLDVVDRADFYAFANNIDPDLVIHCAASYKDPNAWHQDTDTNIAGTINAINVARFHDAKLIYFQTALPPTSSYAISKIAAEQYIALAGIDSLVFRLSNIYGPRNVSGPIPAFYKRLAAGEECTIVDTTRDMVYIDDLVEAVLLGVEKPWRYKGTYDVCSGVDTSIRDLFAAVASHFDHSVSNVVGTLADDVKPQTSVHNWPPGWAPKTKLEDGIANAVRWYSENGVGETYTHLSLKG